MQALLSALIVAQVRGPDGWGHMGGGWWGVPMMLGMLLFWVLIALAIVWLVRALLRQDGGPGGPPAPRPEGPVEVLERRLAEGAISIEEYEQRREVLTRTSPRTGGEAG
jgi:putative membrane protein